jgi:lipopolysaccharide transport system permease protein
MRAWRRAGVIAAHHQLLAAFVEKDFYTRYAGSVLGIAWTQLYPLMLLAVYSFVFSIIFKTDVPHFPLFLFVGIALWTFFSTSVQLATNSVIANGNLVSKVGFPRELVTVSVILMALIDLAASHLVLGLGAVVFGVPPAWSWLALPLIVLLLSLVTTGLGLALATAAVYLRDVRFFVEVATLLLMFMSPVFYPEENVPRSLSWLITWNPLAVAISSYRHAFLDGVFPSWSNWASLVAVAGIALWVGMEVFDRGQKGFPDAL